MADHLLQGARASLRSRRELALENLALRQQLAVLRRRTKRPRLKQTDRLFWVALSRVWPGWREALALVKPATVISWHRRGVGLYWRWKSRARRGRLRIERTLQGLIRQMASENVGWGAPRIHGELLKLGFEVSQATVSRYMPRSDKPPSQAWRTFLANHMQSAVGIDFFVVPTAAFQLLYVFVVLEHARRRIVHVNVTDGPTAQWVGQQLINAFPEDTAPRYLHRDRDSIYAALGIRDSGCPLDRCSRPRRARIRVRKKRCDRAQALARSIASRRRRRRCFGPGRRL